MTTAAAPSISSERQPNATLAGAARAARFGVRLLLVAVMLLPVFGLMRVEGRLAGPLAILGLFSITLVRPEDGLLLCAAFLPIGGPPGTLLGFYVPLCEPFVLAFLAGWVLRETVHPEPPGDSTTRAILLPAWLLAAVVAASTLVQLAAFQPFVDFRWPYAGRVIRQLAGSYVSGGSYPGLAAGAVMLEGIGLFAAVVVLCRRRPAFTASVARMAAVGAVAVAALNLNRLADITVRHPDMFRTILTDPRALRISATFADFNAAGSYFAMMLFVTGGLVLASTRRSRSGWPIAVLLVAGALWWTGSRTAWAIVVLSAIFAFARPRLRKSGGRAVARRLGQIVVTSALVLMVVAFAWPGALYGRVPGEIYTRAQFGAAAVRMAASHPIFGVGVGRFPTESGTYLDPEFARTYYASENAHNNYLQILAELGLAGLVPFLWTLWAVGRRAPATIRLGTRQMLPGIAGGLVAFLLTCLAGHPLLIREVALAFWLVLGLAASLVLEPNRPEGAGRRRRWVLVAAVVCLGVSVPIRAHRFIENRANLEQAAIGFSQWQFDAAGIRYRTMKGDGEFHVPGSVCQMRLGLRVPPGEQTRVVEAELRIDGQVANRVRVTSDSWTEVQVMLRPDSGRRFRTVDLSTSRGADTRLMTSQPALAHCQANPLQPSSAVPARIDCPAAST